MLDSGHNDLRVGEMGLALVADDSGKMVDMSVRKDDRINRD
jgi:hypothetical protein